MIGNGQLTIKDALQLQLHPEQLLTAHDPDAAQVEISNGQWMESVFERLKHPEFAPSTKLAPTFQATLRPYQQRGWCCRPL